MNRPKIHPRIVSVTHSDGGMTLSQPAGHAFWFGVALLVLSAMLLVFYLLAQRHVSTFTSGLPSGWLGTAANLAFDFLFGPPLVTLVAALALFLLGLVCAAHGQRTRIEPEIVTISHLLAGIPYFRVRVSRQDIESISLVADSTIGEGEETVARSYAISLRCKAVVDVRLLWKKLDVASMRASFVQEHCLVQGIPPLYADDLLDDVRRACEPSGAAVANS